MLSDAPHLTVGMPVYNDPIGVRRSVPSVMGQTWDGPIRLLIIDDGSNDETVTVLKSLAAKYPQIDVIRNERNHGRPAARNQILENVSEGYLAWLDAGDLWNPRKIEKQFSTLHACADAAELVICTCAIRVLLQHRGEPQINTPLTSGDQLL
jgi:glycosyltransferase involved in cell wall biosynthesis